MGSFKHIWKRRTDESLIDLIRSGRVEVYEELVLRYQRKLILYVYRLIGVTEEAEDIVQISFLKAYQNLENFDAERKFSSWIYRIVHNEAVNYLKKRNRRFMVSWEDVSTSKDKLDIADERKTPEEELVWHEVNEEVRMAIRKLPPQYRRILILRYYADKPYKDIGLILQKSQNTVGTLLSRAKKRLWKILD